AVITTMHGGTTTNSPVGITTTPERTTTRHAVITTMRGGTTTNSPVGITTTPERTTTRHAEITTMCGVTTTRPISNSRGSINSLTAIGKLPSSFTRILL